MSKNRAYGVASLVGVGRKSFGIEENGSIAQIIKEVRITDVMRIGLLFCT